MYTRIESDSIGSMEIPNNAYYGIHSLRAKKNFNITGKKLNPEIIISLAEIKKAAAITNMNSNNLNPTIANAIIKACNEIINGSFHDEFIVDPIQGGAGTSANMNANEVIANRALELLNDRKGNYSLISPNDHVNMCQSTNDVFPTAGRLSILKLMPKLISELEKLTVAFDDKSKEFDGIIKMGRTQMQDAVPIRLGQSFHAFSSVCERDIKRLKRSLKEMRVLNIGGTAIGTSINATEYYVTNIVNNLQIVTSEKLLQAEDLIDATQNLDGFITVSGTLKTCAVNLSKIANDLRLLSSGPKTGFAEITLPGKQNGSSIMPGKINPVIPEVVTQVAYNVIGNDYTITMAAEAGQLELNAFEPILFYNLFESVETLTKAVMTFTDNCIIGIVANENRCLSLLEKSVGLSTALCPYIGYKKAAEIANESLESNVPIKEIVLEQGLLSAEELEKILNPIYMTECTSPLKQNAI